MAMGVLLIFMLVVPMVLSQDGGLIDDDQGSFQSNRTDSPTFSDMPYISTSVTVPDNFNHREPPPTENGQVDMNCSVIILSLDTLTQYKIFRDTAFYIDFVLACQWRDTRLLKFRSENNTGSSYIHGNIWRPTIETSVLSNEYRSRFDFFPTVLLNDGSVIWAQKFSLNQACLMNLRNYPHDLQCCAVAILTYGGVKAMWNEPKYWVPNSSVVATLMSSIRSDFLIDGINFTSYVGSYFAPDNVCVYQRGFCDYQGSDACTRMKCTDADNLHKHECIKCNHFGGECAPPTFKECFNNTSRGLSTKNMLSSTTLEFKLLLRRHAEYGFIYAYAPTSGIVILSWISFWLDPHSAPARTGLGVTTVLTMISMNMRASDAELGYIRAIDIWLFVCKNFVCFALMEYAVVNFLVTTSPPEPKDVQPCIEADHIDDDLLGNREKGFKSLLREDKNKQDLSMFDDAADSKCKKKVYNIRKGSFSDEVKPRKPSKTRQEYADQLDSVCRIVYPLMFTMFIIGYGLIVRYQQNYDNC
ncbi:GLRA3 [Branchiostoma lanceolatum]|uniref:GLRA3 protein n=1 Tax=Branchiostoma lanceolatum TaxID=7740 RepID=A0A8K0EWU9_BRALA|nr:GLRA3 [Branchiostoma lanceolatum]